MVLFCVLLSFFILAAQAYAAPAKCSLVKVAKKGMRLSDVIASNDIKELLIIQRVNSIQNPYDLKEGLLIMVPDKNFMEKARNMPFGDMVAEIESFKTRIPESVLKEVAESVSGARQISENSAQQDDPAFTRSASSSSLGQLKGTAPEEIERISFPRKPKY
jgi:hypothetical protein